METFLVIFVAFLIVLYNLWAKKDTKNAPPGPRGYPLVGNALSLSRQIEVQFSKWAHEFGEITYLNLFGTKILLLNDPKQVKEVFSRDSTVGRMEDGHIMNIHADGIDRGLVRSEGNSWEQLRRFTLRQLRDFGFGKSSMESMIMEEVNEILRWMKVQEGTPMGDIKHKMSLAVVNALWTIVGGERLDHDDPILTEITLGMKKINVDVAETGGILAFAPWTRHIAPGLVGYTTIRNVLDRVKEFSERSVEEHKKSHSPDSSRDFIDVFLSEMKKKSNDPSSAFYGKEADKSLTAVIADLFIAGTDTTSTTLDFAFNYLASFPDVQKKLQKEIEDVTGNSRQVSVADRPNMPFTEGLLAEILRCSSILPIGVPHRALSDIKINGYDVKKDTVLMANNHYIHYNQKIWGDPQNFRPERFLSPDGKVFKKHEALLAFSVGRRQCLGETLARDTLFLFITNIFQRFTMIHEDPNKVAKDLTGVKKADTILPSPAPYKLILADRI